MFFIVTVTVGAVPAAAAAQAAPPPPAADGAVDGASAVAGASDGAADGAVAVAGPTEAAGLDEVPLPQAARTRVRTSALVALKRLCISWLLRFE
jgi:hypothetical protein